MTELFIDPEGEEAMFQTGAITLKIEQDEKTNKHKTVLSDLLSCPLTVLPVE